MADPAQVTPEVSRRQRYRHLAAVSGMAFAVLFLIGYVLLSQIPGYRATDSELVAFYEGQGKQIVLVIGLYAVPLAGIAFLWFAAALRTYWRSPDDDQSAFLSAMQSASTVLFVGLYFAAAAAQIAAGASVTFTDVPITSIGPAIRLLPTLGYALLFLYAMRAAAVFAVATSIHGLRAAGFPRWLAVVGLVSAAVFTINAAYHPAVVVLFSLWVFLVSVFALLLQRGR